MEKTKNFKQLSVSETMAVSEKLGSEVAKIMNKARVKANKLLSTVGHGVNITADFYKIQDKDEGVNG